MRRKLILSVMLLLVLTVAMTASVFAADSYSYADSIGGTPTTLLTEEGSSNKTWTLYPNIKLNAEGRFVLSGSPVSVNNSNKDSYKGYFYEQGGKLYQFEGCNYAMSVPSGSWDEKKVDGGYIARGETYVVYRYDYGSGQVSKFLFSTDVKIINGHLELCGSKTTDILGNHYNGSTPSPYSYFQVGGNIFLVSGLYGGGGCYPGGGDYYDYTAPLVKITASDKYTWNFKPIAYIIATFDPQSGSASRSKTMISGSTYGTLPTPTRTGYSFNGWFTVPQGGGTRITESSIVGANDITLYADWKINRYTVSFDSSGGSAVAPVTQDYGTQVAAPSEPTRSGYTFGGWCSDTELTLPVSFPYTIGAGDTTLYAKWQINQYTISFEPNGGSAVALVTQDYGTQVAAPSEPTRSGYTFGGWYLDSELTSAVSWPVTIGAGNVTLYAAWRINQYTVSFEPNGGSTVAPVTQDYGTPVAAPSEPTRSGYTFGGWYLDSEMTAPAVFPITLGATDMTLYAKWTVIAPSGGGGDGIITPEPSYTVNFDSNGADELFSQVVQGGDVISIPPKPTREGYVFEGWYKDSACTIVWDSSEKVTKSMTLFAKWRAVVDDNPEDELNKPDIPQKDTDVSESENTNPTLSKDDDGDNPQETELHTVQAPCELEICGIAQDDNGKNPQPADAEASDELKICGSGEYKATTKDVAANKKPDAFSWDKLTRIAVPFLALTLFLLIGTLLVVLISRDKRRKRAYFYDNSGEICAAAIRGNKVDITDAVAQASGKLLKVKISEWYMNKAYGHELELYYNGKPIGAVTINDENVFEIDIS